MSRTIIHAFTSIVNPQSFRSYHHLELLCLSTLSLKQLVVGYSIARLYCVIRSLPRADWEFLSKLFNDGSFYFNYQ